MVNWLYISCKVTIKEKSAVNKWVTLTIGKIKRKYIKSSFDEVLWEEVVLQKVANNMVAT